jgi:hypothetical protein
VKLELYRMLVVGLSLAVVIMSGVVYFITDN